MLCGINGNPCCYKVSEKLSQLINKQVGSFAEIHDPACSIFFFFSWPAVFFVHYFSNDYVCSSNHHIHICPLLGLSIQILLFWQGSGDLWSGKRGQLEAHKLVKR